MASSLSQKVRSFNIFFCFGVFAFGAVLNGILIYLVLTLCCWQRRRRVLCFRYVVRLSFRFFLKLCGVLRAFSVQGPDFTALKDLKGAIFIANHPSLVDYIILSSRLPISTSVMVKAKLTHSFMRFVIYGLGYVTNECDPTGIDQLTDILNDSNAVYYDLQGHRLSQPQKGINILKVGNKTMKIIIK